MQGPELVRCVSQPDSLSSDDSIEAPSIPAKDSTWKTSTVLTFRNVQAKDNLARRARAYERPIRGSVLIPGCIPNRRPRIHKLLQLLSSAAASGKTLQNAELDALKTPVAPVNKDTMKELELGAIQNNTSLRIDLCFDDHLFFQPVKGRKGEDKQRRARVFWDLLAAELEADEHALRGDCVECASNEALGKEPGVKIPSRLAVFFTALRELIAMLVPEKDKEDVLTRLDIDHLVRTSRVEHFDAIEFSGWLAKLLMTHCAPLRDAMARKMNKQISDGARARNMLLLVRGLETLLSLLENMKLDVANHQVRSFKLLLIADTVPFLKDCFSKMKDDRQLDRKASRRWFKELQRKNSDVSRSDFDIFLAGAVALCRTPCTPKLLPPAFTHDKERLTCMRDEILELTLLRICVNMFNESALEQHGRRPTTEESATIWSRFLQLVCAEDGTNEGVYCHLDEIATEIARAVNDMSVSVESGAPERRSYEFDLQSILDRLDAQLRDEKTSVMDKIITEIVEQTAHHASRFQKLSTLEISNAQRAWSANRSTKNLASAPDVEDLSRRLAHVIVLHWSVWESLAYVEDRQLDPAPNHCGNPPLTSPFQQGATASRCGTVSSV